DLGLGAEPLESAGERRQLRVRRGRRHGCAAEGGPRPRWRTDRQSHVYGRKQCARDSWGEQPGHGGVVPGYGFAPGQHSVAASYSGDGSYGASQAPPFNFTVKKATPLPGGDVSCGVQEAVVGTLVCLISGIHVAFLAGKLPTGTITWFLGNKR